MTSAMFVSTTMFAALLMHPIHETVCEVEWNAKTNRVEVALRLDALDEQWIATTIGAEVNGQWQPKYLRSQLVFDPTSDKMGGSKWKGRPLDWVGRKFEGGHVWWFFEVVCEDGRPPTVVQTRLLFDRHQDYQHRLVVLGRAKSDDGKRPSILLTRQKPTSSLKLVDE